MEVSYVIITEMGNLCLPGDCEIRWFNLKARIADVTCKLVSLNVKTCRDETPSTTTSQSLISGFGILISP